MQRAPWTPGKGIQRRLNTNLTEKTTEMDKYIVLIKLIAKLLFFYIYLYYGNW